MKIQTKYIVAGGLAVISLAAAAAYLQYKKLMNYCIGYSRFTLNKLGLDQLDCNIFLKFTNKSSIKIEIQSQEYLVYLNNQFVLKASNAVPQVIAPLSTSEIGVNVAFSPRAALTVLKLNATDLLLNPDKVKVRVDMKMKVKLYMFTVSIPYVYESTLKEMTKPSPVNAADKNKKPC